MSSAAASALPTGIVTFLLTDIEGSTARWESAPEAMRTALSRHDEIMRDTIDRHGGVLFETAGDSFVVAFADAPAAVAAAVWAQRELSSEAWPMAIRSIDVRMAVHTGRAEMTEAGYAAQHTLSRQSRILAAGHGGQILLSGPAAASVASHLPEAVQLRSMGRIWLKDLIEPEEIVQVVASSPPWSLSADFPPLRTNRTPPGNLPAPAVPFVGRDDDVEDVVTAVLDGSSRVTTLLGPGGIGKTRLALRVAERVQHHFVDGAFFVDLAPVTDPTVAVSVIASTVGVADDAGEGAAWVGRRLADREMLIVLDNLEQVIDVAVDVATIIGQAPRVRILATSRVALRILHEAEYPLEPLGLADGTDFESISGSESVRLFVERSRASARDFALSDDNATIVAAICRRLEGIPLAIVLAAARSRVLEPARMLALLDRRLDALTDGARDLPRRHQALRDTIEWSHDLLGDAERDVYARVSVHAGSFRLDAATAVVDAPDVAANIQALVDASLLHVTESVDGDARYRMLETIGEHAYVKLESTGLVDEVEHRHASHFLELAEEASGHVEDEQIAAWYRRLDEEHDNIRRALRNRSIRSERRDLDATRTYVRFAAAMGDFWLDRGHLTEGVGHLEHGAELARRWLDAASDDADRSRAQESAAEVAETRGLIARRRDDLDVARDWLNRAIAGFAQLHDDERQARSLISLGTVSFHAGDLDAARSILGRSLELATSTSDRVVASALFALGNVERDSGNPEAARRLYERALAVDLEQNDLVGESVCLNNLANLAIDTGEVERARELHLRSLELRQRVGARMMLAESIVGLAVVAVEQGRHDVAARLIGYAEATAEHLGGEFDPMERRLHVRVVEVLRDTLDDDVLGIERAAGRMLTDADVVELAHRA
ncbi:MAG: tetratricopeptide repeat protein [Actinomycetota bacterium]